MIDFRYHLVSLVSVFLALAVGIVLGAGPLKDSIDITLTDQVSQLREDRDGLREEVARRDVALADRDAFGEAVAPTLVSQQLGGRSVVIVALPGADEDVVDATAELVTTAGASVSGRVQIRPRWTDPDQSAFRSSLAGQLVQYVDPPPPEDAGPDAELGAVLAEAVLTSELAEADQPDPDAQTILSALTGGELITVAGEPASRATLALVVSGSPEQSLAAEEPEEGQAGDVASYVTLARVLDERSSGVVVLAPRSSADAEAGLLSALRADAEVAGSVSTVDVADVPMGRVAAVFALREQLGGSAGQYGTGDGAGALLPAMAAPVEP